MSVRSGLFVLCFGGCLWQWYGVFAQESPNAGKPLPQENVAANPEPDELRDGQLAISGRYARFERMLSQMADVLGRQDPERADLLRRALGKGREDQVKEDIEKVVDLLSKGELGTASEKQTEVVASLETLLKLLQSEDRRSSVERERERLNALLKDVRNVISEQKSARAATQNAEAPSSAAPGQQKALKEADQILEEMKEHDKEAASKESSSDEESKSGDQSENESPSREKKGESSGKDGKQKAAGEPKEGDAPRENIEPGEGKESKEGKGSESSPGAKKKSSGSEQSGGRAGNKESKKTPGQEQLENARKQMEEALEELKAQEREKALKSEDEAIAELHEAAEKLEEMLKQLREEEKELLLASLEARFQRMLAAESQIHEETVTLAATPQKDWLDQYYGRCRELAQQQVGLTSECSQTVNLLREDGTSVSILMAVEDIESDMQSVSLWLQESKVAELTQSVQLDIIESLKQLIETTQKEMQNMKEQQQDQQKQQNSQQKQGLVELMAEIRMLRNLQLQVNRRTKQVDELMKVASTDDLPSLEKQVRDLAVRQRRLIESARELSKQKGQ